MTNFIAPFCNEPFTDFTQEKNSENIKKALDKVEASLGQEYKLVIDGKHIATNDLLTSINPANTEKIIGKVHRATTDLADQAIEAATRAFQTWKNTAAFDRAGYLFSAAAHMRRDKFEWSAWLVYEIGKSWAEADADVAEAIDFMEFYAREAIRYEQPIGVTPSPFPDEINQAFYIPLGVGIIIPPWNFPLAIMVGMTTAAIAAGNTVVLKPSSDTPVIAAKFVELMERIGLPKGVLNFLPCRGGAVGDFLVEHPKTRFIAFTGSMEVGLRINELAAKRSPGQLWIKRVIAEMGGKDTIVVDESADLDAAATGIVTAAFGFSGQKCSACSRAVIVADVYDAVLEKVVEQTKKLTVGPTTNPSNFTGPVASKSAYESILNYIEIGKSEGRVLAGGGKVENGQAGYFIQPTIIADVDPKARIAQEEIFGPVLAVIKAKDFDEALDIANNTQFGLTGALYSNHRERLNRARRDFHVGNLYLNRKCTGALVDVHPFGGFNMSGTDSKAGGRDYLLLFSQSKSVAEKF